VSHLVARTASVPSLNFHYTTSCRPGGGRDPGPGWIPAFAGMMNRTVLLGFQPCSLVTSFARRHTRFVPVGHYTVCRRRDPVVISFVGVRDSLGQGVGRVPAYPALSSRPPIDSNSVTSGLAGFDPVTLPPFAPAVVMRRYPMAAAMRDMAVVRVGVTRARAERAGHGADRAADDRPRCGAAATAGNTTDRGAHPAPISPLPTSSCA
jgi:hypothetical protein